MSNQQQSSALAVLPPVAVALKVDQPTWSSLSEIYGNPRPESLALVINYCKARNMDPLKKPVHIVPVYSKRAGGYVDTIWPSIGEVRMTAMRTKSYAGREVTEFGPTIEGQVGNLTNFKYPEWARVTVYRLIEGHRCAFPGPRVYWLESYAKAGRADYTPNEMWGKRPFGQLEKCAEAASLRAAFPEEVGTQATADEMAGREIDDAIDVTSSSATVTEGTTTAEGTKPEGEKKNKRAAVPKGAAAVGATPPPTEPVVDVATSPVAETKPAPAAETTPAAQTPPASEPAKTEPAKTEPAKSETPPPAKQETKPANAPAGKKIGFIIGEVTAAKQLNARNSPNPKITHVTTALIAIAGGEISNGYTLDDMKAQTRFMFDPELPELQPFSVVSKDSLKLWIEMRPSSSDPTKMLPFVVKAEVDNVDM